MDRHRITPLPADAAAIRHAYRLRSWPQIPDRFRTARVLGALSRMTIGPVTDDWFLSHTGLESTAVAELLASLQAQDALDTVDLGPRGASAAAPEPQRSASHWRRRFRLPHR